MIGESVGKVSGSQFLADIALKVKRKRVGIVSEALVHMPQQFALDRIKVNRNAFDRIAPAVKIAEHMPA